MDSIRKNSQLISLFFTIVMFFFVVGIYANTVKNNQRDIDKIQNIVEAHSQGIAKCIALSNEAKTLAVKSMDYNKKIETLMLEIKTELASIKTDITWIKSSLKESKQNRKD